LKLLRPDVLGTLSGMLKIIGSFTRAPAKRTPVRACAPAWTEYRHP